MKLGKFTLILLPLTLGGLFVAGCASTNSRERSYEAGEVGRLVSNGRYTEALELAAEEAERHPKDEEIVAQYRMATAAWHLGQGRDAFYEDQDELALEHFEYALEAAPEAEQAKAWIEKLNEKLSESHLAQALHHHTRREFDEAAVEYEKALQYRPDHIRSREGLGRVLLQINHRNGQGEDYYRQGVRDLSDYLLYEARAHLGYASKYLGVVEERVNRRGHQVDGLLAAQRFALAQRFERERQYAAARNEYRLALLLAPDHEEAQAGYERCKLESEAMEMLKHAELLILKGRFDEARTKLQEGQDLTMIQKDLFAAQYDKIDEARIESIYNRARDLETDFLYEEAIVTYEELLENADFYADTITRRDTLQEFVAKAKETYERVEQATDPAEQLNLLRQIELVWPEYLDVPARVYALEQQLEQQGQ